ncbi:MAG: hypothetical protein KDA84_24945 [Planctomycetaceae bacterium]|nr:hypothetical protein [Planctomycetaceae bacterium]
MMRTMILLVTLVGLSCVAGCGDGLERFPTAKVSGRVVCKGEPVPYVRVIFEPIADGKSANSGKAGRAEVQADGTFLLSTYGNEDGAVIGMHRVKVLAADDLKYPDFKCDCIVNDVNVIMEVEVKDIPENSIMIELPEKGSKDANKKVIEEEPDDFD